MFSSEEDAPPLTMAERMDDLFLLLDRCRAHRSSGLVAGCVLAVLIGGAWWVNHLSPSTTVEDLIPQVTLALDPLDNEQVAGEEPLLVHVVGAVENAGVVELPPLSRVIDALEAAGGPSSEADLQQLNLAAQLSDGEQIRVPVVGETLPFAQQSSGGGGGNGGSGLVNINLASVTDLERLPGVGPSTAAAIVSYRDENGRFDTVEGLLAVSGIGPAKLQGLADHATIR